jgi:curved DNA-binding protein CbpA
MLKYYRILDIPPGVSEAEVKKAYRKKAQKYHPDKNSSDDAQKKFLAIQEAYQVLTSPPKTVRKKYSAEEMADAIEKRFKHEERERLKEKIRKMRQQEHQNVLNSPLYKFFVRFKRFMAYLTLGVAANMILTPIVTFFLEVDSPYFEWKRIFYFLLIMLLGGLFMVGGIYMIRHPEK